MLEKQAHAKQRSEQRKQPKRYIKRDVVTLEEYEPFMSEASFSHNRLIRSRQRMVMAFLYITGCRIDPRRCLSLGYVSKMF